VVMVNTVKTLKFEKMGVHDPPPLPPALVVAPPLHGRTYRPTRLI